ALLERRYAGLTYRIVRGDWHEHSDAPHSLRLLRMHGKRPPDRHAAKKCDELAPSHCLPEALDRPSYRFKRSSLRDASMSALGHKRTFALQKVMSALPPKADIGWCGRHVR